MLLLRSVIFLALVSAGVWYFLAEPDRRAEMATIQQALQAEADQRHDSLTASLEKSEQAGLLIARSTPVAALVQEQQEPQAQQPATPPVAIPDDRSEEQALDDLAALEALAGLHSVRILKNGAAETVPALAPPAELLTDGRWEAGIRAAFQAGAGRAAYQDDQGDAFYVFFTPFLNENDVPAIIIAEARLSSVKSRWETSNYRLALTGRDGKAILSNATETAGPVIEVSRDIPALNAALTVAAAQPGPLGPWTVRSGAVVLIALLILSLWEVNRARRRHLSKLAKARRATETRPEDIVLERTSGPEQSKGELGTGESLTLLGQVSDSIGQEISRPLSAIRSHAEAASRSFEKGDLDIARDNIRQISNLADRISRIIANMRGFVTSQPYQIEPVLIRPVVHEAAVNMLERDPALGDFFFMEVAEDVPDKAFVRADKTRLSQVIDNILSLSWDACRDQERPELVISIQQTKGNMIVSVDYSGQPDGPPESDRKRVGAVAKGPEQIGQSVSFSIAKFIVEGMGGKLDYKASALGGGRIEIIVPKFRTDAG